MQIFFRQCQRRGIKDCFGTCGHGLTAGLARVESQNPLYNQYIACPCETSHVNEKDRQTAAAAANGTIILLAVASRHASQACD